LYPTFGKFPGLLGWTSTGAHKAEGDKLQAAIAPLYAKFKGMKSEDLAQDKQAMAIGERLFMNNCAQCHGSDARGSRSFPNLADKDWLWGGDHAAIKNTLVQGRMGVMPPMGAAVGTPDDVLNVAHYVMSLSKTPHDPVRAVQGAPKFAACAACHGADGKGNTAMGAPNLTDKVWLYGGSLASVVESINKGRNGVMPAWEQILGPEKSHIVSAYVYSLSHKADGTAGAAPK
jgi:cytochrome c oxidase cbb3-type subunit 3